MAMDEQKLRFVMLPFMAQGHMIPMVDIAKLLAKRGLKVTILTTPHNANRFTTVIDGAAKSGLDIDVLHLRFPCLEAGLPKDCQNLDMVTSLDCLLKFVKAVSMMRDQAEQLLQELNPFPSCIIADGWLHWSTDVALKLNIPRLIFTGSSCFSTLCIQILGICNEFKGMASDSECFVVPGLPHRIEVTKAQFKAILDQVTPELTKMWDQFRESEVQAFGTVANTFIELESEYIEYYRKINGKKIWCIGPVSLCNDSEKTERDNKASICEHECLKWLDSQESRSVLYVCLGSMSELATSQLIELGLGLEASNRPFIWVIRNASDEFQTWLLEEKFEERNEGKGLLIRCWAPQVVILSHPSVGGFLTHCGWNSTLEAITAGVPMITWPLFGEQFFNEKLIVNVMRSGVRVGAEVPAMFLKEENMGVMVKSGEIKRAVEILMHGEAGKERRKRVVEMGEMAKRAVEEGGSSYLNITLLIQDVKMHQPNYAHA